MAKEIMNMATNETLCVFNDPTMGDQYCSFSPDDMEGKIKLYNAINSPSKRLGEMINTPITVRDVVLCKVMLGERDDDDVGPNPFKKGREAFRTILIDADGKSYTATSTGIYNSVCTLRNVFGDLHFEDGLKLMVKQITVKNGITLTLQIIG